MTILARVYVLAGVLLLAAACSFLQPRPDTTQYFVLTSEAGKAAVSSQVVIGIDRIELPEYLMRPEIVTRTQANQLKIADNERWGEPLKDGFSRTLRSDLESQLGIGNVLAAPFDSAHRPGLTIDLEVRRFERVIPGGAVLEATWTLRNGTSQAPLLTKKVHLANPAVGTETHATVTALSHTLALLAAEIADSIRAR